MKKLLFLSFLVLLSGCGHHHCPGFPTELLDWNPYNEGVWKSFYDGHDTLKLKVESTEQTTPYIIKPILWYERPCLIYSYSSLSDDLDSVHINVHCEYASENSSHYSYEISFRKGSWGMFSFTRDCAQNQIYKSDESVEFLPSYNNSNKEYPDVLMLQIDTTVIRNHSIYKVYISKSIGIIQFWDRTKNKTWNLIES